MKIAAFVAAGAANSKASHSLFSAHGLCKEFLTLGRLGDYPKGESMPEIGEAIEYEQPATPEESSSPAQINYSPSTDIILKPLLIISKEIAYRR